MGKLIKSSNTFGKMAFYDYAEKVKHRVSFCQKNHNLSPKKTKQKKTIVDSLLFLRKNVSLV